MSITLFFSVCTGGEKKHFMGLTRLKDTPGMQEVQASRSYFPHWKVKTQSVIVPDERLPFEYFGRCPR